MLPERGLLVPPIVRNSRWRSRSRWAVDGVLVSAESVKLLSSQGGSGNLGLRAKIDSTLLRIIKSNEIVIKGGHGVGKGGLQYVRALYLSHVAKILFFLASTCSIACRLRYA